MGAIELTKSIADRVLPIVAGATESPAIMCGAGGIVLSASSNQRIGTVHEGAAKILRGEIDEIAITEADVMRLEGVTRASYVCAIMYGGNRVGTIGIAGDPSKVRGTARLAAQMVQSELVAMEQKQRVRDEVLVGLQNASAAAARILEGTEHHRQLADELEQATVELKQRSSAATEALALISNLALRANMLGLNAAVEAAHAGKQGAGFVVVANEIRKLADRTKASAVEISATLADWQKSFEQVAGRLAESGQVTRDMAVAVESVSSVLQSTEAAVETLTQ